MKEFWLKKNECTGCGACSNICPKNNIAMKPDMCGFIYPIISETCVDCNLCEKICMARGSGAIKHSAEPTTYATWSNNDDIRYHSTSGGVFSELSKAILHNEGFVAGAQYRQGNLVEHIIVSDDLGLERIRQSKYIQSEPSNIYREIKLKLSTGRLVGFCGAPCQVAALYAYLGRDCDNLITFDFICRGMNSPKAYLSWLKEIEENEGKKITRVWFKYKEGGWNTSPRRTRIDFNDGSVLVMEAEKNLFMHGYLTNNLYIRPSCGHCKFKEVPRQGDITLADFWGIDKTLDDDKGTSMLLVNSEKGKILFDEAKENLVFYERNFEEIYEGNVCFNGSVNVPAKSEEFLRDLDSGKFSEILKKYTKSSLFERGVSKTKRIIKKLLEKG